MHDNDHTKRLLRTGCLYACMLVILCGLAACGTRRPAPGVSMQAAHGVVASAHSQLGARYRLGGNSPGKGFDCSGLVQWAYKQQGINVPRITTDQARAGRLVAPREGLRPADILVFKTGRSPRGLHTGIYAGGGEFIHSPRSGQRVRTESLDVASWKNSLIGARRLIH